VVEVVDGNRVFTNGHLGVSEFRLSDDDLASASSYDIVHTGECSGLEDQLADLAEVAAVLSFDFSERPWDYVEQFAPLVNVATWSSPTGDIGEAMRAAERLRALGPATVAVTLGSLGAVLVQETALHRVAPAGVVVDTLGAGDAFIARLLVGLQRREPPADVLAAATAYATQTCADFGAFGYGTPLDHSTYPPKTAHHDERLDVS
jgi:fructoselysine 6-kinase